MRRFAAVAVDFALLAGTRDFVGERLSGQTEVQMSSFYGDAERHGDGRTLVKAFDVTYATVAVLVFGLDRTALVHFREATREAPSLSGGWLHRTEGSGKTWDREEARELLAFAVDTVTVIQERAGTLLP